MVASSVETVSRASDALQQLETCFEFVQGNLQYCQSQSDLDELSAYQDGLESRLEQFVAAVQQNLQCILERELPAE